MDGLASHRLQNSSTLSEEVVKTDSSRMFREVSRLLVEAGKLSRQATDLTQQAEKLLWEIPSVQESYDYIDQLPLSVRAHNCLKTYGDIPTISSLTALSRQDLMKIPNLGKGTLKEIVEVLAERGLRLRGG